MMDDIDCTSALDVFATGVTGFNGVEQRAPPECRCFRDLDQLF